MYWSPKCFHTTSVSSVQEDAVAYKDCLSKYYYYDCKLFYTESYDNGKRNGEIKRLYKNGNTWTIERYKKGVKSGTWEEYYAEGMVKYEGVYKKGVLKEEHYYNEDGDEMASPER